MKSWYELGAKGMRKCPLQLNFKQAVFVLCFYQVKKLRDAINYKKGHICRGKPREAHTFEMIPNQINTNMRLLILDHSVAVNTQPGGACKPLTITDSGGNKSSIFVIIRDNNTDNQV